MALFGHGTMSDLSPLSAAKRTSRSKGGRSGWDPKRASGAGQAMSTDGWQFSGDAGRFLQGGQWPRCARKALSAEFRSEAPRRSRQMVPQSMNGAYSDRGSQESFAIRLPDATIQSERVSHRGRYGAGTALGRCTK